MNELLSTITPIDLVLLGVSVIALVLAWLAFRRAGLALRYVSKGPGTVVRFEEREPEEQDERPPVALEITANKDEHDQVALVLSNTGRLIATQIHLFIDAPEHVFNADDLGSGVESAEVKSGSAIHPRLTVLDEENVLPIAEIQPNRAVQIPAALTMAYGKICDFPVSMKWKDEDGVSRQMKGVLTV
ncbi:MAG: hypothetical protein HKM94_09680 [Halobacteria archaeon]|nr:hypothetical protein [Halobacteria archaeon]